MTSQAGFVLVDCRDDRRYAIDCAHASRTSLWWADAGSRGELQFRVRPVRAVAIHAIRVPIIIQQQHFGSIVEVVSRRQGMADLRHLRHDVRDRRRQIGPAAVASHAVLGHRIIRGSRRRRRPQQPCRSH